MTYILGIVKNNTSYIVGDSVITSAVSEKENLKKIHIQQGYSSFGEKTIISEYSVIQELTKKIYIISDEIIIAFAGNAKEAYDVIDNIKESPLLLEKPIECVDYFTKHNPSIQLLLSIKNKNKPVELYNYNVQNKNRTRKSNEGEYIHLGSLNNELKAKVEEVTKVILNVNIPNIKEGLQRGINLKLLCSFMQTFRYSNTINNGIGGTYFGTEHFMKPNYLDDIAYLIVKGNDINTLKFSLIGLFNRGDRTIVNSPFLNKPFRILEPYIPPHKIKELSKRNLDWLKDDDTYEDIYNRINRIEYEDFIFLHQNEETGRIKILYVPNFDSRTKDFFEIKGKKVIPKVQEFLEKIIILISEKGELIDVF